ncbi:unnamed protein product, partial [Amoebophrya sp. A25]
AISCAEFGAKIVEYEETFTSREKLMTYLSGLPAAGCRGQQHWLAVTVDVTIERAIKQESERVVLSKKKKQQYDTNITPGVRSSTNDEEAATSTMQGSITTTTNSNLIGT